MKKDRNCNGGATPYPIYGGMPMNGVPMNNGMPINAMPMNGGMPIAPNGPMQNYGVAMPIPSPMPAPVPFTSTTMSCGGNGTGNEELNRIKEQIQNLDRRVSRLESMTNNKTTSFGSNQYTDANYHIM